ncbi:hypothetical protein [Streptomyces fuscigenes]|uniref:hypothetical protein n=1 Tax=Streptomyces fuscigenes TaxID=1528880 RepID=UPI001F34D089|nr:hypothetical protein [Streptomyces fuscigenes]MCF3960618.1 hypothetical protein [Streptomyces fuscigenes]
MAGKSCCGGGGASTVTVQMPADNEVAVLCDAAPDGTSIPFLRRYSVAADGTVTTTDTALDGTTAYATAGTVTTCGPGGSEESPGATPSGKTVIERCGCDDTDGDGTGDVQYTELWAVDPDGVDAPALLGAYQDGDLTQPYTPVAPVECTSDGDVSTPTTPVTIHTGGANLDASASATLPAGLQSLTVITLTGNTVVTTDAGPVTIPAGASLTWSVTRGQDQALTVTSVTTGPAATALVAWTYAA